MSMSDEVVISVNGLSKRFCRTLKRSLFYGVSDIIHELFGINKNVKSQELQKDQFWAINDLQFELHRGEILGLIGHNGAGKSTVLKILSGLLKPDSGKVRIRGNVGALIELGAGFNPILTGRENIYINGAILGFSKREIDSKFDAIVEFSELGEFLNTPVRNYSSGMKVRLGFSIAVQMEPDVLLIDEVLAVGDVAFKAKCFNKIGEFKKKGISAILVSHSMHHISRFCQRTICLQRGKPSRASSTEEAIGQYTRQVMTDTSIPNPKISNLDGLLGTGKIKILNVNTLNQNGELCKDFSIKDSVTIRIEYDCKFGQIEEILLDILISDVEGVFFQGNNRDLHQRLGPIKGKGHIDVRFGCLPVNNRKMDIFLALWNLDFSELYDWKRHIPFTVHGNTMMTGRTFLCPEYEIHERLS